jgi:hypothetical protein
MHMWHNGTEVGVLHPVVIRVVSTAAWPSGLGVRLDFEHGQVLLLPSDDARLLAGGLLDAAADIERVAGRA